MTDFEDWQKHVNYIVATQGRWYGIGDGDGNPLFTLPEPSENESPEQWMDSADLAITLPAQNLDGTPNRAARLLLLDSLVGFDPSGKLPIADVDYTLLVAFPGPDGKITRRGGIITHTTATDPGNTGVPTEITINALSFMDVWNTIPAASWPAAWWKASPYPRESDESKIPYSHPWHMARIELATRSTFVFKTGKAGFVIRRLAQESLDAVMFTQADPDGTRWVDDQYHIVEVPEIDTSEIISLEDRDGFLWDTVAGQAKNAGVILGAYLWWPGDAPVRCWNQVNSSMPPEHVDITPSQGSSARSIRHRTFTHPMIVLTVKEVWGA